MRIIKCIWLPLALIMIISCKKDKKTADKEPTVTVQTNKTAMPTIAAAAVDDAFRVLASKNSSSPEMEDGIWHYLVGLSIKDSGAPTNQFEGQWIDLQSGGIYKKGLYADTTENGLYTYDTKSKILQLRALNTKASSEWKTLIDPYHMVLIGTSTYGNNSWQIKLKRMNELPIKK